MTTTFTRNEATYTIREDALRQLQKTEAIGRLARGVAHDFNNLLTVIVGCGELLEQAHGSDPDSARLIRDLLSAAEQGRMLTRQLLTFSRDQRTAPVLLTINDVVGQIDGILRRLLGERVELQTRLGGHVGPILADPGEIQQVLLNLVMNARDAMPLGGTVVIETGLANVTPASREGRTGVPEGVYSTLTVRDSGCGMTREVLARMFDPFFTTKGPNKGTGLGLCTVHDVVRRSNGYIRVASKPGVGSRFRIFFPLAQESVAAADVMPASDPMAGHAARSILVAEDSPSLRWVAVTTLRKHGYQVIEAANGAEALALAESHPGPIDLLFTDIRMPKMTGPELAAALGARRPGLRVIYTTGYDEWPLPPEPATDRHGVGLLGRSVLHRAELGAGRPVLLKPYWPDELLNAVGAAINAPSV
jgi:nitrogen-specific signal transduction histidine kinase/CheY-like chemotaxis protein